MVLLENWTAAVNTSQTVQPPFLTCFHFTNAYFDRIDESPTPYVITSVLNAFFSVTAFCGNILLLSAIWKTTSLSLPSKLLIFNLALTDFATGLIVQPLFAALTAEKAKGINDNSLCIVRLSFHLFSSFFAAVSLLTVTAIGLERYTAVRFPSKYKAIVKPKRIITLMAVIWLYGGLWTSTWILKNALFYPLAIASLCFCLPLTLLAYISIYRGLRKQERLLKIKLGVASNQRIRLLSMRNSRRSATSMLYIYCLLLLCYLPYLFTCAVLQFTGISVFKQTIREFATTLSFVNSTLNPIVYCWRLRTFRSAVWKTLFRWNVCVIGESEESLPRASSN